MHRVIYSIIIRCFSFLLVCSVLPSTLARPAPYVIRISCGADNDVQTPPTNTLWLKDFAYTGGIPINGTRPSYISPNLHTVRNFPLSEGPNNCYNINGLPNGQYSIRIFFGIVPEPGSFNEPLFDVSIEGTLIYSLPSGWSTYDDERVFVEALVYLNNGAASICFHSTGHGDPSILAIELNQVDNNAYYFGSFNVSTILRTHTRLTCGTSYPRYDADYKGDRWGGDRFWNSIKTFGRNSDRAISSTNTIKQGSVSPNVYPEGLYKTALVSTNNQLGLEYTMELEPSKNYSLWLHFAEIDPLVTKVGQRVFDILINEVVAFTNVDIVNMAGDINTALVLNTTVAVNGRSLTITMIPKTSQQALINAIEVFEVITEESRTLQDEVEALQSLKSSLALPLRFGWNGDPCAPEEHPWSGADCQFDQNTRKWFIDGLGLDNQGLGGFLPDDISKLSHLQIINLSGNSIYGPIPDSIGNITTLEILDVSYNLLNGSIPESLGKLTSLQRLLVNSNFLTGKVPAELGGRLVHGATFNFTDNSGLCGIPGLRSCGHHLSAGAKIGIIIGVFFAVLLLITFFMCWRKRRQNILRSQNIGAAREAPYAKKRTHFNRDVQMTIHNGPEKARTVAENGPALVS